MDDEPTVNRRDAVAGISLLGVLAVAVVGSLAYRVVDREPGTPGPGPAVATQPAPAVSPAQVVVNPTTPPLMQDAAVRQASINEKGAAFGTVDMPEDRLPTSDELFPPEEEPPAPRFVAPGQ